MPATLFSPLELRGVRLKNRIVASPMWQYAGVEGRPTDTHVLHLGRMAEGGAGLVFQEGTSVDRTFRGTSGDLALWDDDLVAPMRRLVEVIRSAGAVPGVQLVHGGRKGRRNPPWNLGEPLPPAADDWRVAGPSAVPLEAPGYDLPEEMSRADVAESVVRWTEAARRADEAGYEVLELHAGHGYLLHTFLSPLSNHRTDEYGGTPENRARLLLEVVDGVRSVWPGDKPLFVRLSSVDRDWDISRTVDLVRELQRHDVDVIDCSSGSVTGVPTPGIPTSGYGYQVPYAEAVRAQTGVRTMAVGGIVHAEQAEAIVESGQADLTALGRELLYNPHWPMDAARKLGVDDPYALVPQRMAYWLAKRDASFEDFAPSTEGRPLSSTPR